ncbi:MAG: hypothetical protein P1S60_04850, partial [Anaerolineae bacterium]|nr:hypothetical protein [Anaerolineae bacterium]
MNNKNFNQEQIMGWEDQYESGVYGKQPIVLSPAAGNLRRQGTGGPGVHDVLFTDKPVGLTTLFGSIA